jgi:hypothetical protein
MDEPMRGFPQGAIRVSDAERDAAVAELSLHYQDGRLTAEEFDDRSAQAFAAKTGDQLSALFADLPPRQLVPVTLTPPATGQPHRRLGVGRTVALCVVGYMLAGNLIGALVSAAGGNWGSAASTLFPTIIILGLIFAVLIRPRTRQRRRYPDR